jgi:hypothetical protein
MKTDAEYLTEHVLGRYFCPCSSDSRRRVQKKHVKESARHAHETLNQVVVCMADHLHLHLKKNFYYFPESKLASALVIAKALKPMSDFRSQNIRDVLCQLIYRDDLVRCQSTRELIKHADLVTAELLAREETFRLKAIKNEKVLMSIPAFANASKNIKS